MKTEAVGAYGKKERNLGESITITTNSVNLLSSFYLETAVEKSNSQQYVKIGILQITTIS